MISLKRTLAKLAMLALSASPAAADPRVSDGDCELDGTVPIDRGHVDTKRAGALLGKTLAAALVELSPFDATYLVTTWAVSDDPLRRIAVATALAHAMPVGARTALEHLARDPDPDVRAAVSART